jgi:hypothetical protein
VKRREFLLALATVPLAARFSKPAQYDASLVVQMLSADGRPALKWRNAARAYGMSEYRIANAKLRLSRDPVSKRWTVRNVA